MKEIRGSLQEIFEKFLADYFERRLMLDSFDMIFEMIGQELRKIDASDDKLAILEKIHQAYASFNETLNLRRKEDKELYLPLNIKYSAWERYWQETIRAAKDSVYPDFSFSFDMIEKYSKTELEPQRAMEYLRWVYSRFVREYRSNKATEVLKIRLLNLIDDLELNLDNRRSRIGSGSTKTDDKVHQLAEDGSSPKKIRYLDTAQAMKFLNVSKATLWRYRQSKCLSYSRPAGKVLYAMDDLIQFMKKESF